MRHPEENLQGKFDDSLKYIAIHVHTPEKYTGIRLALIQDPNFILFSPASHQHNT
jgi:hypothetical protein